MFASGILMCQYVSYSSYACLSRLQSVVCSNPTHGSSSALLELFALNLLQNISCIHVQLFSEDAKDNMYVVQ